MTAIRKRQIEDALDIIRDVRRVATMKSASFKIPKTDNPFAPENDKFTEAIREATRIWRDSWITGPLDEVIEMLEKELAR